MNPTSPSNHILLTIDVEDWFQVENFKRYVPFYSWPSYELRVEKNTHRILDLLDSITCGQSALHNEHPATSNQHQVTRIQKPETRNSPKASFFVLGWIAKRLPNLVREIHIRGHEVASHGYYHKLCNEQSIEELKQDLTDSKKLLEDIIGAPIYGYRAPSFSINNDILKIIEDCNYLYDSSFNSFGLNKRYGQVKLAGNGQHGIAFQVSDAFYEIPISNLKLGNSVLPWGGGGYFRLIPSPLFRMGVESILKKERAYLLYMHPWEIDPKQPVVNEASPFYKFRHYQNLNRTYRKLQKFIESFKEHRFISCGQYIDEVGNQSL